MNLRIPPQAEPVKDFTKPSIERGLELALRERDELRKGVSSSCRRAARLIRYVRVLCREVDELRRDRDETRQDTRDLYDMRNWDRSEHAAFRKRWPRIIEE